MHREKLSNEDEQKLFRCNAYDIDDAAVLEGLVQKEFVVVFEVQMKRWCVWCVGVSLQLRPEHTYCSQNGADLFLTSECEPSDA